MSENSTASDLRADAQRLVRHLIDANEPHQMPQFQFGQPSDIADLDGRVAHEAMRTATHLGWVEGEPCEFGDGAALWQHVHVTPAGMRQALAWPPAGREHAPGPWDTDHWGVWALPCLKRLREDPIWGEMPASFAFGDVSEEHRTWLALRLLGLAEYIDVHVDASSATGATLTLDGRRALEGAPDPFDAVRRLIAQGDITRALIDLVEGIIQELVAGLAERHGVPLLDRDGKPLVKLRQRVDRLAKVGVLAGVDAAILRVALEARNDVGHTTTDSLEQRPELIAWIVEGIEAVSARHAD